MPSKTDVVSQAASKSNTQYARGIQHKLNILANHFGKGVLIKLATIDSGLNKINKTGKGDIEYISSYIVKHMPALGSIYDAFTPFVDGFLHDEVVSLTPALVYCKDSLNIPSVVANSTLARIMGINWKGKSLASQVAADEGDDLDDDDEDAGVDAEPMDVDKDVVGGGNVSPSELSPSGDE